MSVRRWSRDNLSGCGWLIALLLALQPPLAAAQVSIDMQVQLRSTTPFASPGLVNRLGVTFRRSSSIPMVDPYMELQLPAGMTFLALQQAQPPLTCSTPTPGAAGTVRCSISPTQFYFDLQVDVLLAANLATGTTIEPVAKVASGSPDPDPSNNQSIASIYLQEAAALADIDLVVEAFPNPVAPRGLLTHRVAVTNHGPNVAIGVQIVTGQPYVVVAPESGVGTRVPGVTEFTPTLPAGWTCHVLVPPPIFPNPPFGYNCSVAILAVGETTTLVVTSRARADVPGPIFMEATISSSTPDPNAVNNDSGETNVVIGFAPAQSIPISSHWQLAWLALLLGALAMRGLARR